MVQSRERFPETWPVARGNELGCKEKSESHRLPACLTSFDLIDRALDDLSS